MVPSDATNSGGAGSPSAAWTSTAASDSRTGWTSTPAAGRPRRTSPTARRPCAPSRVRVEPPRKLPVGFDVETVQRREEVLVEPGEEAADFLRGDEPDEFRASERLVFPTASGSRPGGPFESFVVTGGPRGRTFGGHRAFARTRRRGRAPSTHSSTTPHPAARTRRRRQLPGRSGEELIDHRLFCAVEHDARGRFAHADGVREVGERTAPRGVSPGGLNFTRALGISILPLVRSRPRLRIRVRAD